MEAFFYCYSLVVEIKGWKNLIGVDEKTLRIAEVDLFSSE